MLYLNLFVTGEKAVGKSTIVNRVLEQLDIDYVGFRTLPYEIEGVRQGFYLSGLVEVLKYKNNAPISVMVGRMRCVGIKETFETLGVEVLMKSLERKQVILMDELGKLEYEAETFQEMVQKCLESQQIVIGVLKQCEAKFIQDIIKRRDTIVFEVTQDNREQILEQMINEIKKYKDERYTKNN